MFAKQFILPLILLVLPLELEANDVGAFKASPFLPFPVEPRHGTKPISGHTDGKGGHVVTPNLRNILKNIPKANKADVSLPRLDASSPERLQQSFADMLLSIDDDFKQQAFAGAMAAIGVVLAQNPNETGDTDMLELLDGRSAEEIMAISRELTPQIRNRKNATIDGSSAENFGKSVGGIMVSLPVEKQGEFSEAIAKLMYEAKQKGEPDASIERKLDGKTAQEVVDMAANVDLPFKIGGKISPDNVEVSSPSDEDFKKFNIKPPEKKEDKDGGSYTPSLVPSSNL